MKQNPFKIGNLYRLRKLKPPILPFYELYDNQYGTVEWIGTTNAMHTDHVDVMLCIGSIHHPHLHSYTGIFLVGDNIVGVAPEWITDLLGAAPEWITDL